MMHIRYIVQMYAYVHVYKVIKMHVIVTICLKEIFTVRAAHPLNWLTLLLLLFLLGSLHSSFKWKVTCITAYIHKEMCVLRIVVSCLFNMWCVRGIVSHLQPSCVQFVCCMTINDESTRVIFFAIINSNNKMIIITYRSANYTFYSICFYRLTAAKKEHTSAT